MEHRWGERISLDIGVRIGAQPFAVGTGRLLDLSMSGANLKIRGDLRVLSRIQVALMLPSRRATPLISAYVTRRHRDGVGIEWCEFAPQPVCELLRSSELGRRRAHTRTARTPDPAMRLEA
jgi:PilZ domain-containing protein